MMLAMRVDLTHINAEQLLALVSEDIRRIQKALAGGGAATSYLVGELADLTSSIDWWSTRHGTPHVKTLP